MADKLDFELKESHPISDIHFITQKLTEFNNEQLGLPKDAPGPKPYTVIVKDDNGEIIAGTYADLYMNVLNIHGAWVHKDYRKQGIGRKMGDMLEDAVSQLDCHTAVMDTYSFQKTMPFYTKFGVLFSNRIKNTPKGHSRFILIYKLKKYRNVFSKSLNKAQKLYSEINEKVRFIKSKDGN